MVKLMSRLFITYMSIIPQLLLSWTHLSLLILLRVVRHPPLCNTCRMSFLMSSLNRSCGSIGMILRGSMTSRLPMLLLILFTGLEFVTQLIVEYDDRAAAILSMTKECAIDCRICHLPAYRNHLTVRSFALCAVSALFKYLQTKMHSTYSAKSLQIRLKTTEGWSC
jgi:hypothetical protein